MNGRPRPQRNCWHGANLSAGSRWDMVYVSGNGTLCALVRRRGESYEFSVQGDVEADFGFRATLAEAQREAVRVLRRLGGDCQHERYGTQRLPPHMKLVCANCLLDLPDTALGQFCAIQDAVDRGEITLPPELDAKPPEDAIF